MFSVEWCLNENLYSAEIHVSIYMPKKQPLFSLSNVEQSGFLVVPHLYLTFVWDGNLRPSIHECSSGGMLSKSTKGRNRDRTNAIGSAASADQHRRENSRSVDIIERFREPSCIPHSSCFFNDKGNVYNRGSSWILAGIERAYWGLHERETSVC
jgi:hypothetical protein